ncbi:MAG: NADH-quinone oxidoreductase subunit J [Actinobacteria bacterium]|nr:NADH-quinone oxidoreductase subunit J [Actinomycetota bacterium]
MIDASVFLLAAALALGSGVAMVLVRNAVHAALFLVASQLALAVLFLIQGAFFIAALQIIVYAGAIMVLFVFVVMLLGVDKRESLIEPLRFQREIGVGLGVLLIVAALYLGVGTSFAVADLPDSAGPRSTEGNVEAVARELFTHWALPFEITSVLLIVAVVGTMVLAKRRLRS